MGGIIRSGSWWWDYFQSLIHVKDYYITGNVTLAAGKHQIRIDTEFDNPKAVYLTVEEPDDGGAVCIADLNWVAAKVDPNGFNLFADVRSNSCVISYIVEYSEETHSEIQDKVISKKEA